MPPKFHPSKLLALFACALAPHLATAADICWINNVTFTPAAATVQFNQGVRGLIMKGNEPSSELADIAFWIDIQDGTVQRTRRNGDGSFTKLEPTPGDFALPDGQLLSIRGGPHDSCSLLVTKRNGKRGLLLTARNYPPGFPMRVVEKFIEAD